MNPATATDLSSAPWRKARKSTGGGSNCVEVARLPGIVAIRDSKNPHSTALIVSEKAFHALIQRVKTQS